eukprot:scaffold721_cov235-Pinguiococcus_pyrenoidosus.AAC.4
MFESVVEAATISQSVWGTLAAGGGVERPGRRNSTPLDVNDDEDDNDDDDGELFMLSLLRGVGLSSDPSSSFVFLEVPSFSGGRQPPVRSQAAELTHLRERPPSAVIDNLPWSLSRCKSLPAFGRVSNPRAACGANASVAEPLGQSSLRDRWGGETVAPPLALGRRLL